MQLSAVSVQLKFMKCSDCRLQLYLSVVQFCGSKVQCSLMAMQCSCKAPKYSINQCIGETLLVVVRAVFHTVQQWWIVITQFRKKWLTAILCHVQATIYLWKQSGIFRRLPLPYNRVTGHPRPTANHRLLWKEGYGWNWNSQPTKLKFRFLVNQIMTSTQLIHKYFPLLIS